MPESFQVPKTLAAKTYKLAPLGPGLEKRDYDAYMSSIDHLRATFSGGGWPHAGITMEDALKDVQGEKARFDARHSFTYAVLSPDGSKELGCLYIKPSPKQGYDATATIWVTKAMYDAGFEATLVKDMKAWLGKEWPFQKIAWPKREIAAEDWKKLPDKPKKLEVHMTRCALTLFTLAGLAANMLQAETLLKQSKFTPGAEGWTVWSARAETRPNAFVDQRVSRGEAGSLAVGGASNAAEHGGWERKVEGIAPGAWYRFTAFYQADAVAAENWQIVARLEWRTANGKRAGQPEYVAHARREGNWTRLTTEAPAPPDAASVAVQLFLSNAPAGTVWWDDLTLEKIAAPGVRAVRVASINLRPRNTAGPAESVGQFIEAIEKGVRGDVDVILLPEGITVVGTTKTYAEVAESIPGPTTERLAEVARKRKSYVVAGIYEREGTTIYNTAVMLDRTGALAGKYRKVYLPREEVEKGLTPGNSYPVFGTDFGKVGLMICYDVFFSDPARALATQGAEMILMPIWGGDETLAKARAIENQVFLVASGYDHPTYVMDPTGERLSEAREQGTAAMATVDLNRRYTDKWLGDMHTRRWKEHRVDVPVPVPGLER